MDEGLIAGLVAIFSALPGIGLGLALLMGKWRPASLGATRHPERARIALGGYLIGVDALVVMLGIALMALPLERVMPMVPYAVGALVAVATVGLLPVLRAARA